MRKVILLADDSATIRRVVELTFSDQDCHVECVASGSEALQRLETLKPDLVLADVVMPGPSGYEICRKIKASPRPIPVLLLAGTFETFDHEAARACGLMILAQLQKAGVLEDVEQVVKLGVFVNSSSNFTDQPKVANGASDLMVDVFGEEDGRHSRAAVGVRALPLGAAVEVDAIFAIAE